MTARIGLLLLPFVLAATGCGPVERATNPGAFPRDKIEEAFREELKFRSVELRDSADGTLTGSGVDADGRRCEIVVRRRPEDSRFDFTYVRDDGGKGSGGLGGKVRWLPLVLFDEAEREVKKW